MKTKFFVPFRIAKMLADYYYPQDFDPKQPIYLDSERELCYVNQIPNEKFYVAPTYAEVVDWIDELYDIHIDSQVLRGNATSSTSYYCIIDTPKVITSTDPQSTREEAVIDGIENVLQYYGRL